MRVLLRHGDSHASIKANLGHLPVSFFALLARSQPVPAVT